MGSAALEDIQKGWKVYAGSEEVGEVADVGEHAISVRRGTILRREFRVPEEWVTEATDGVVDLSVDRSMVEAMEVDGR